MESDSTPPTAPPPVTDNAAAEAEAEADVSGPLLLKVRGFLGLTTRWKSVHVYLKGTQLAVCQGEGMAPKPSHVFDVAGCSLAGTDASTGSHGVTVGFVLRPVGKPAMTFQCAEEADQTKWMSALLEAKLSKSRGGGSLGDQTVCSIQ
eukprot:m.217733 g.217733  ORF g.217733 m.217733 type:complete len:148 (+) comp29259_c0_seq1:247-690(+)